jgi:hypothetical protein
MGRLRAPIVWILVFTTLIGLRWGPLDGVMVASASDERLCLSLCVAGPLQKQEPDLIEYRDEAGQWSIWYSPAWLTPEQLTTEIVVFRTEDRLTFLAVDGYQEVARNYGNMGENLRNRSRDTLELIFGEPVTMTDIFDRPSPPWRTGISFTVGPVDGWEGEAVYTQPSQVMPVFRAYGVLWAYPKYQYSSAYPQLQSIRDSFAINQ